MIRNLSTSLGNTTIVIRLDGRTALLLALGVVALVIYISQAYNLAVQGYGLLCGLVDTVHSIHFNLVQAPLEAAINSVHGAATQKD